MASIPFSIGGGSGIEIVDASGNPIQAPDTIQTVNGQTITPTTNNIVIPSERYTVGAINIAGDADLKATNIRAGKSIFGVSGSLYDMNDASDWFNNGGINGKPYEGGKYCTRSSTSSSTYYHTYTNQTVISVYAGYGSGVEYNFPYYDIDWTPYKGIVLHVRSDSPQQTVEAKIVNIYKYQHSSGRWLISWDIITDLGTGTWDANSRTRRYENANIPRARYALMLYTYAPSSVGHNEVLVDRIYPILR